MEFNGQTLSDRHDTARQDTSTEKSKSGEAAKKRRAENAHDEIKNRSFCIYDRLLQIIVRKNPVMDISSNERYNPLRQLVCTALS